MKAIVLKEFGSSNNLELQTLPVPTIGDREILIRMAAGSVNPVDVKTRMGKAQAAHLRKDPPMILGWDISGTIEKTGKLVHEFSEGDEVFGMIRIPGHGRCYAEYVSAPVEQVALKPAGISHEQAAGAGIAGLTAYQSLKNHVDIQPGMRILVHAASGGVGHYAVQIAKLMGAFVIGTSSAANKDFVLSLGADEHVDYRTGAFENRYTDLDLVIDAIGGEHAERSLRVVKEGGTVISLPSINSGHIPELARQQKKNGVSFFVKPSSADLSQLAQWMEQGKLATSIEAIYPLEQIRSAHDAMESGRTVGKIILTP